MGGPVIYMAHAFAGGAAVAVHPKRVSRTAPSARRMEQRARFDWARRQVYFVLPGYHAKQVGLSTLTGFEPPGLMKLSQAMAPVGFELC